MEKMGNAQVYVKIDDYKSVLGILEHIKEKLSSARSTLDKLKEIRREEDSEFEQWESSLNEIGKRIDSIDNELMEPEGM